MKGGAYSSLDSVERRAGSPLVCANPDCVCRVSGNAFLPHSDTGAVFCSEGCRLGMGCGHADCDCIVRVVA